MPSAPALDRSAARSNILELTLGFKRVARAEKQATTAPDGTEIPADALYIEGYASTPNVDRYQEIVSADAFKKGIQHYLENPIILFAHDDEQPIGVCVELDIQPEGLFVRCAIVDEDKKRLIKAGVLRAFSIGFRVKKIIIDTETEIPTITELDLLEISVVAVPANQQSIFQPKAVMLRAYKAWLARRSDLTSPTTDMPTTDERADDAAPETTTADEATELAAPADEEEEPTDNGDASAPEDQEDDDNAEAAAEPEASDTDTSPSDEEDDDASDSAQSDPMSAAVAPDVTLSRASNFAAITKIFADEEPAPADEAAEPADAPAPTDLSALTLAVTSIRQAQAEDAAAIEQVLTAIATELKTLRAKAAEHDALLAKMPARKALPATPAKFVEEGEPTAPAMPSMREAVRMFLNGRND